MTQQMPQYLDKGYPTSRSTKPRDENKFHDWYVDIEKYETVDRCECVARFVGNVFKGAGSVHDHCCPRRKVG